MVTDWNFSLFLFNILKTYKGNKNSEMIWFVSSVDWKGKSRAQRITIGVAFLNHAGKWHGLTLWNYTSHYLHCCRNFLWILQFLDVKKIEIIYLIICMSIVLPKSWIPHVNIRWLHTSISPCKRLVHFQVC